MNKPDPPYDYERRRAEDVFRALENEVFPRLGAIDTKIEYLEGGVNKLMLEGCAMRAVDTRRVDVMERGGKRIFEKMDTFAAHLSQHQLDVTEQLGNIRLDVMRQVGGIKIWVQAAVIAVLLGISVYFAKDYLHDIENHVGKSPYSVEQKQK